MSFLNRYFSCKYTGNQNGNYHMQNEIEAIYTALENDNEDLEIKIKALKEAMKKDGAKEAAFDPDRLVQGNREGRKRMQSVFKKRGVKVVFKSTE